MPGRFSTDCATRLSQRLKDVTVTDGSKKLTWRERTPDRVELYDLEADPREQQNLYDADDSEAQRLLALAREQFEQARSPWDAQAESVDLDEMRLGQLRALGYVIK